VKKDADVEIWTRPLADRAQAVGVFNRGDASAQVTIRCEELHLCGGYQMRDVWTHADAGTLAVTLPVSVPSHGVVLWRLTPAH
jgi:alpha-galactosidase